MVINLVLQVCDSTDPENSCCQEVLYCIFDLKLRFSQMVSPVSPKCWCGSKREQNEPGTRTVKMTQDRQMLMLILQRKKKESEEQQAGGSASARSKVVDDKDLLPPTSTIEITLMHSHRTRIARRLVKKKKKKVKDPF